MTAIAASSLTTVAAVKERLTELWKEAHSKETPLAGRLLDIEVEKDKLLERLHELAAEKNPSTEGT